MSLFALTAIPPVEMMATPNPLRMPSMQLLKLRTLVPKFVVRLVAVRVPFVRFAMSLVTSVLASYL